MHQNEGSFGKILFNTSLSFKNISGIDITTMLFYFRKILWNWIRHSVERHLSASDTIFTRPDISLTLQHIFKE